MTIRQHIRSAWWRITDECSPMFRAVVAAVLCLIAVAYFGPWIFVAAIAVGLVVGELLAKEGAK